MGKLKYYWNQIRWFSLKRFWNHLRNPENVWYGGGLKRETALICVGKGWAKFVNSLYDCLPRNTKVWQVKEKYAGLRFYINGGPGWYNDLIQYYEEQSYKTCEVCGEEGTEQVHHGWYKTVCKVHYEEWIKERS
ncbi:MAG: hypothetical protein NTZ74_06455 [Chloroflexi bacterium]|nr:hypothetical protein [Chloroflexota bacterium]